MIAGEEPIHRTFVSAIFEARLQPIEASPIHCESQTRIGESGLGLDVQYAGGKESILRRQGACKQGNAAGKAGFERLSENRKSLGQLHAIDPELHIGMFAAYMDLAKTVLRNCGRLQQDLVQRHVLALGYCLQCLGSKIISAGAKARLDLEPGGFELLGNDLNLGKRD
jgi:hypothetical protein